MKFASRIGGMLALIFAAHAVAVEPDFSGHRFYASLASDYRNNEATLYNARLRTFYTRLRMMDSGKVLRQVARLQSFCSERDCDGMQPIALALADRLATFDEITAATANEALAPIFALPMGLNEGSPNFALSVGNSRSAVVRSLRPEAAQALYRIYGRRLADSPLLKTSIDSILTFDELGEELCGIETHSAEAGAAALSDKEKQRAEICGSEASSGGGSAGAGSTGGFASIGALINTVSVNACADVSVPPHSVNADQFSSMLQDCLEASSGSGELNQGSGEPTRLTEPDDHIDFEHDFHPDGTVTVRTIGTDGVEINRNTVPFEEVRATEESEEAAFNALLAELNAVIEKSQEANQGSSDSGGGGSTGGSSDGGTGASADADAGADSDSGSGDAGEDSDSDSEADDEGDSEETDEGSSGGSSAESDIPHTGTSNTAVDGSTIMKATGLEGFINLNNAACLGVLATLTGGKVKANIMELDQEQWPTVVNPNPQGPFPWDEGEMSVPCGSIDVATGRGVACNLPILCGEGESLNEDCSCTSGDEIKLGALMRTLDASHCLALHCDNEGVCICSGESLPGGIVIPEDPLAGETPKIDE